MEPVNHVTEPEFVRLAELRRMETEVKAKNLTFVLRPALQPSELLTTPKQKDQGDIVTLLAEAADIKLSGHVFATKCNKV
jgi:hypothetical protein